METISTTKREMLRDWGVSEILMDLHTMDEQVKTLIADINHPAWGKAHFFIYITTCDDKAWRTKLTNAWNLYAEKEFDICLEHLIAMQTDLSMASKRI